MKTDWFPWVIAIGNVLVLDGWMIRRGYGSLSVRAGDHPLVTVGLVTFLGCHLLSHPRWFGRFDILSAVGRVLEPRAA